MRKEILISFIISILFIHNFAKAEEDVSIAYTIINDFNKIPTYSLARVIFLENNLKKSLPLKILPIKPFNKYFAYANVKPFKDLGKNGFLYFDGSSPNSEFGFYNFKNLSGNINLLKKQLREKIEGYRKDYSKKLEEEKEFSQSIVRLRKDARLISGYDKIELLQKEKALLRYKIEEVRNKKQFLEKIIASTQESEIPRNYQNRLEQLIAVIKKLAKAEGSKINLDQIFSAAYVEKEDEQVENFDSSNKASNNELSSELEYLIRKRRELEQYFGYEPDEFSMGVDF